MPEHCFILVANLSLFEFISAEVGFVDLFSTHEHRTSLKVGYDEVAHLATFSVTSNYALDEESIFAFERGVWRAVPKERIFSFYNNTGIATPVHFSLTVDKVTPYPSLLMEAVHRKLTLQRFGLTRCSHVVQKLPGDLVIIFFHSLEDTNVRIKQLVADSLGTNKPIFEFQV